MPCAATRMLQPAFASASRLAAASPAQQVLPHQHCRLLALLPDETLLLVAGLKSIGCGAAAVLQLPNAPSGLMQDCRLPVATLSACTPWH